MRVLEYSGNDWNCGRPFWRRRVDCCIDKIGAPEAASAGRIDRMKMAGADAVVIRFQCPKCGHELEQTIASLKLSNHMSCKGCGVGINIDTNRLANAADEIQSAIDKIPPEITIKFFQ
jgi:predicted RNA-binding Zn-ribbon protein involved in translation (DUF1610 family)